MNRFLKGAAVFSLLMAAGAAGQDRFRPPAVPLITHDPYFSIWSMGDLLAGDVTRHWTGTPHSLAAVARIDGVAYRVMGKDPEQAEAMRQTGLEVTPTRTVYRFEAGGVRLQLSFLSPLLAGDLEVLGRPVSYLTWEAAATDGRTHKFSLYFDASAQIAVNTPEQPVESSRFRAGPLEALRCGTRQQPVLEKAGDNLRIDWGYLYAAARREPSLSAALAGREESLAAFVAGHEFPAADDTEARPITRTRMPVLAFRFGAGSIGAVPVSRHLLLAYDDLYSIVYFERRLRPWWRRHGETASDLLQAAERDYAAVSERCAAFDGELMADLGRAGGTAYAHIGALAYRQTLAANKLVADASGAPLLFPKENFSNGCIGTVDVIYPSAPLFLLFNPALLEASLAPVLDYAGMSRWKFPFAPHDLGVYPHANGQVYGGGEKTADRQMPVEESGNMLLLAAAIARAEGRAAFAERYWPLLSRWARYLKENGLDPENQLSTDDFMGHLAHQANLSLKAILAIGAYGQLCDLTGRRQEAAEYRETARRFAARWQELAGDGDHYRLAFDVPGSWSQKYNLVWDRLLDLKLFPEPLVRTELAWYRKQQDAYGVPLDSRKRLTKLDWLFWTASLEGSRREFEEFIAPAYRFVNETPDRVPLADGHFTESARQRNKAQARSVVGGVFVRMLYDAPVWDKWVRRTSKVLP